MSRRSLVPLNIADIIGVKVVQNFIIKHTREGILFDKIRLAWNSLNI